MAAISKLDLVLEAIQQGKTNDEIRDEIDGRLSDKRLDGLRNHPEMCGGDEVKSEIDTKVAEIFAPAVKVDTQVTQLEIKAECDLCVMPKTRIKQTGAEYKGLIGYYVDNRCITLWADGTEIEPEEFEELISEIRQMIGEHKRFVEESK